MTHTILLMEEVWRKMKLNNKEEKKKTTTKHEYALR